IYGIFAEVLSIGKIQNRHIIEGEKITLREASLILMDEAHQFRNERSSRFRLLRSLTDHTDKKWVLMTATPINKSPKDLHTLTKFYTNDAKFAKTVKSDSSALSRLKDISLVSRPKDLSKQSQNLNLDLEIGQQSFDYADLQVQELKRKIETTLRQVLPKVIVRENRTSLIERVKNGEKILINGKPLNFPDIRIHKQPYSIENPDYPNLLRNLITWIENFKWTAVLPEVYLKDDELRKMLENTAKLNGKEHFKKLARHPLLYRAILQKNQIGQSLLMLKRMESSLDAFRATFGRLKEKYEKVNAYFAKYGRIPKISTKDFSMDDTEALMNEDVTQIRNVKENMQRGWKTSQFLDHFLSDFMKDYQSILELELILKKIESDKYEVASNLIDKYVSGGHKVLVFTQFTDTLSGFKHHLHKQDYPWLNRFETVSSDTGNISGIVERFCPESAKKGNQVRSHDHPVDVLVTTDVLSEGQNLQDCDVMVNFDFCWTPLVLLQRFGRINRVNSRHSMNHLIHLLPSAELDDMLNLMTRLKTRFDAISFTIGGDVNLIDDEFNAEKTRSFLNASGKEGLSWEPDWANFQDPMIKLHHRKDLFINGNGQIESRLRSIPDKSYSVVQGEFKAVFAAFKIGQEIRWKWWRDGLSKEPDSVLDIFKAVDPLVSSRKSPDDSDLLDALELGLRRIEVWMNQLTPAAEKTGSFSSGLFDQADDQFQILTVTETNSVELLQWIVVLNSGKG
ncbi:MAG: DEAD/DEAH box helicase, partial [Bacteroidetes bacterium]|nr:DEAD/DEAH box helicase [Bacteroidota bacterium]